ncbi:hypothetical protein HNY73_019608 [Argiope bruennichi]|uniref:Uncharacterized protein n=1 Tax=Argiope bruennichi TaxID=94029 RepID=A0A8T0E5L2_ARGBR|nr:hypothetical protein HNY73_019608 [Argiope bruennichi]
MAHLRRTKAEKMANLLQENGSRIPTPPVRSQKLRKPPPPPTTNTGMPFVLPYPNPAAQNNMLPPIRPQPAVYNNVPPVPYPSPGAAYFPNQMRPPVQPYGYNPYPGYQYPQPARFGHYK